MHKATLLFFLLLAFLYVRAQQDTLFADFIRLFPGKPIPAPYQVKFLQQEPENIEMRMQFESRVAKEIVIDNGDFIVVSVQMNCGAGGACEGIDLYSFSNAGVLADTVIYQERFGDCGFMNEISPLVFNDSQLIVKTRRWKGNCNEQRTDYEKITVRNYLFQTDGMFDQTSEQQIDLRRKYAFTSYDLLKEIDLRSYSKDELAVIRNEIFAAKGYQFTSEKWRNYFREQEWYVPIESEVKESDLSLIERQNLQLIKSLEGI